MSSREPGRADPVRRVCFVTPDFAGVIRNGGIGTHYWLMSRLLAQRGWDVHVLFCGGVDDEAAVREMPARLAGEGIAFTWLDAGPEPDWWGSPSDDDRPLLLGQWALQTLEELHARHRFELIEFADWGALGFRAVQAKRAGVALTDVRLAVKLHSTTEWQRRGNLAVRRSPRELATEYCERYAFEHADVQFSPSRYMVQDTRAAGWDVRDDVVVAYPFPAPEPGPAEQLDAISELAFFGRLERRKGLDLFLDALDELRPELPVLFLGRDARIDGRRASEIIAERIGDRPHRIESELDREGALAQLRAGGRLAVIASQSETFGFTVAECVANRIPFLAARAGGIPEVVRHAEARERWLFEPTVSGLVSALQRRLASDGANERQLRAAAAEACDPQRWNDEVEASYRAASVLEPKPQPVPDTRPPTVSVAVTCRDQADRLPEALASLAAQTRPPDEVLVIDGSGAPRASAVFSAQRKRYRAWTFVRDEHDRGLERATGTYFLPFDAADIAAPGLIDTLLTAIRRDAARAVVTCQALAFADQAGQTLIAPTGGPRILAASENVFGGTCALFDADALRAAGGFEQEPNDDWGTLTKLAFAGLDIDVVPRVLVHRRAAQERPPASDRARSSLLQRRLIERFLVGADLTPQESVVLWECVLALGAPSEELELLQASHEDLERWAHRTIAEIHAWRESQLEELREFLQDQLREANERADRAEHATAPPVVPLRELWEQALQRTARGGARAVRARLARRSKPG